MLRKNTQGRWDNSCGAQNGDGRKNTGLKSHHGKQESHLSRMHRELPRAAEIKAREKDNGLRETGLC